MLRRLHEGDEPSELRYVTQLVSRQAGESRGTVNERAFVIESYPVKMLNGILFEGGIIFEAF